MLAVTCFGMRTHAQNNIGIGTTTPHASALLDLSSTTKGLLLPRMTSAQRTAIASPSKGLIVFDTDINALMYYNGSAWASGPGSGNSVGFKLPYDTSGVFSNFGIRIKNTAGTVSIATLQIDNANGIAIAASSTTSNTTARFTNDGLGYGLQVYANNGVYAQSNAAGTCLYGLNSGTGKAVWGSAYNGIGIYADVLTTGTGTAAKFENSNTGGYALETVGKLKISGGNTSPGAGKVLTSDLVGNATWQKPLATKVGFSVSGQAGGGLDVIYASAWAKMSFLYEHYDPGNDYNLSNQSPASVFIAPANGFYQLNALAGICFCNKYLTGGGIRFRLERNGVTSTFAEKNFITDVMDKPGFKESLSGAFRLLAGDKIWVEVIGYSTADHIYIDPDPNHSFFNGFMVHEE